MDPFVIADAARHLRDGYDGRVVAEVSDPVVRMSVMTAPFVWHRHPDSDAAFRCIESRLIGDRAERSVTLEPGAMLTVPAGAPHRTRPQGERSVTLTFERQDASTERLDALMSAR